MKSPDDAKHRPPVTTDENAFDLASCESEPIRIPGSIQPHGVLLALDPVTFAIEQVSENCAALLGQSPDDLIGKSPEAFLGRRQYEDLLASLDREALSGYTSILAGPDAVPTDCLYSRYNGALLVELQPAIGAHSLDLLDASLGLEAPLERMRVAPDAASLVRVAAAEMRALSGFDRVMVYRFDEDWHGIVIAEEVSERFPVAYLGLHFPASDIPAQARELYLLNTLRLIPDIEYVPVPIRPAQSRRLGVPLDLSRSDLRSVSPIHIEYLRNIGVRATLTISIVVHGKLWGLIACHHDSPRRLNHAVRSTCNFFAQALALQLTASIDRSKLSLRIEAGERIASFLAGFKPGLSVWETLLRDWKRLLSIFAADAVYVRGPDGATVYGSTLTPAELAVVVERLASSAQDGIASSSALCSLEDEARRFAPLVSGALYIALNVSDDSCLVLLRREQHATVTWAGNPAKPADRVNNRLTPRASFTAWEEITRNVSLRWSADDHETAASLRGGLMRRQEAHDHIRALAHDVLTGLPNRRYLNDMLARLLHAAERSNDLVAVLFIDIDRFKRFNDRLGHAAGDRVLRHVAKQISGLVREGDVVGRLNGDEFVVIMPALSDRSGAEAIAERLLREVAQPVAAFEGRDLRVTLSIGISVYPADADTAESLLEAADSAMYQVKKNGRGAWLAFKSTRPVHAERSAEERATEPAGTDAQAPSAAQLAQREADDDAIFELTREELDALPFGVITLDRLGRITRYNLAEGNLARTEAMSTIGKNFFTDVAPCTNIAAFRGRFDEFVRGQDSGADRFDFSFRFRWGRQDVSITMLRKAGLEEVNILVRGHLLSASAERALFSGPAADRAPEPAAPERATPREYHVTQLPPPTIFPLGGERERAMRAGIHADDAATVGRIVAAAMLARNPYTIEYRRVRPDNSIAVVQESGSFGADGDVLGSAVLVDVTARRETEERHWRAAHYDYLTRLPNRETLLERIGDAVREAELNARIAAVIVLNIDKFRDINETFGYDIGTRLLPMLALRLGECVRGGDTVARLDGDRFALLLTDVDTGLSVADAVTRLIADAARPFVIDERQYRVTVSCGISVAPYDSREPNTLIRLADTAMCAAKAGGRNSFRWYAIEMSVDAANIARRHHELRAAIERDELELHYQPIVDVERGRIVAVESLVRWNHPTRGFLPPGDFIALADRTGLIVQLGEWVLREAARQAGKWCAMGFDLRVCVNVSAVQFRQPVFFALVESILLENNLAPNRLELELTESVLIDGFGEIMETFGRLKKLGLRLSIDDFGTGYSSLSYLKYFPIDTLKIDRSFVADVASDEFDRAIASTILTLANELDFECIVEGIENFEQLETLRAIGCTFMQGYYFCRPTTPEKLQALLGEPVPGLRAR